MTTIDKLFRHVVIIDTFLRNKIFYHMSTALNCRTINYKFCVKLSFLLFNRYFELIKLKIKNKEYLYLDGMEGVNQLFRLKDVDLEIFIAIFNQLDDQDYKLISSVGDILQFYFKQQPEDNRNSTTTINYDNKILEYLLFDQKRLVLNKSIDFYKTLCKRGYLKIIQRSGSYFSRLVPLEFKYLFAAAISSKNILLVKELYDKSLFNSMELHNKQQMLLDSIETKSLPLFTLVSKYFANSFFLMKLRRKEIYTKTLLKFLLIRSLKANSFDIFMYLVNTFDMSLSEYQYIFILAIELPTNQIIDYLLSKNLVPNNDVNEMCLSALQRGKYTLYEQLQTYFNNNIDMVPEDYQMGGEYDPPFKDISRVEYLINKLNVRIRVTDVIKSTEYPETFKCLLDKLNKSELPKLYAEINSIIAHVYMYNTPEVLMYIHNEHGVDFTKTIIWTSLCIHPQCSLKTIQTVLTIYPPTLELVPTLCKVLEHFAHKCKTNNISAFELLFDVMYNGPSALTRDPNDYIGVFKGAIRGGRILTLQYLYNQGLTISTITTYIELLKEAAQYGSLSIIKYILEHQQEYEIPLTSITETAMIAKKYDCVDYLLHKEVSQNLTIKELVHYCIDDFNMEGSITPKVGAF